MHFPIIELTTKKKTPEQIKESSLDYDDVILNYFCDYFGEEYSSKERKSVIADPRVKALFAGIADVDEEEECVRFRSEEEINDTLDKYYRDVVEDLANTREVGWIKFYNLRRKGYEFHEDCSLFVVNDCTMTSMMFFEDCYHYASKVLYFGQIYDAHC